MSFLLTHFVLGRKISIPYALALGENAYAITATAFILDIIQIPIFLYLYTHSSKIGIINKGRDRIISRSKNMEHSRLVIFAKKMGKVGIIALAAMPIQGGGMWSGVLLAHVLNLKRWQTYLLLSIGSFVGCIIISVGVSRILSLI